MPVPRVVRITRPGWPLAAPKLTSARPAPSASLTMVTWRPSSSAKNFSASRPVQDLCRFAMNGTRPCTTGAGMVRPTGASPMVSEKLAMISAMTAATFWGVDFSGVAMRSRSAAKSPFSRSTGAPLMPDPPTSMPRMMLMVDKRSGTGPVPARGSHLRTERERALYQAGLDGGAPVGSDGCSALVVDGEAGVVHEVPAEPVRVGHAGAGPTPFAGLRLGDRRRARGQGPLVEDANPLGAWGVVAQRHRRRLRAVADVPVLAGHARDVPESEHLPVAAADER